jgi:transposase
LTAFFIKKSSIFCRQNRNKLKLPTTIEECHEMIKQQFNLIVAQSEQLAEQSKQITYLSGRVTELSGRITELEARLNQNSQNSSKPPSSDLVKPKRKPGVSLPKKARGGQKGHTGNTLKMSEHPDDIQACKPARCSCGKRLLSQPMELHARRQVFDIPTPSLQVTEFQQWSCNCPTCGKRNIGVFPSEVKAPVQYGDGVRALATLLSVKCQLSHENISGLFEDLFGQGINPSTIQTALEQAYQSSAPLVENIKKHLLSSAVINGDETGIRIHKNRRWLHVLSNSDWTYLYVHLNRGRKAIQEQVPQLYAYQGVLVHDCWASYWSVKSALHSLCNPHILRELTALIEQGSNWAGQMHRLLMRLYYKYIEEEYIHKRSYEWRQYKQICRLALAEEPKPIKNARGKPKKSKGRNLVDRLINYQEEVLRFALEKGVPFSNNQAERDLRPAKGKMKIAGCFRTWDGAHRYARLQSLFSTWKKQGYHIFKELKAVLSGHAFQFEVACT